jgi:putative addiction module component (TIGR02574 family)
MLPESTRPGGSASSAIAANPYIPGMAAVDSLLTQALQLPEPERRELVSQLLRSLEPDDGDPVVDAEWEAAWGAELDRRSRDLEEGLVELIDGEQAHAHIRATIAARRGGGK